MKIKNKDKIIANAVILKTGELLFYDKNEMVISLPEAEIMY